MQMDFFFFFREISTLEQRSPTFFYESQILGTLWHRESKLICEAIQFNIYKNYLIPIALFCLTLIVQNIKSFYCDMLFNIKFEIV